MSVDDDQLERLRNLESGLADLRLEFKEGLATVTSELGAFRSTFKVLDHEQRIRSVEKWKWATPITVVGALVAGVLGVSF